MDRMELTNKHVDLAMGMRAVETAVKQPVEIAGMVVDCIENWGQYCGPVRGTGHPLRRVRVCGTWEKAIRFAYERCLELAGSDDEVGDHHLPPYELTACHVLALYVLCAVSVRLLQADR